MNSSRLPWSNSSERMTRTLDSSVHESQGYCFLSHSRTARGGADGSTVGGSTGGGETADVSPGFPRWSYMLNPRSIVDAAERIRRITACAERLDAVARETERNRSWLISNALETYLDELEDLQIARERLDEERVGSQEMRKRLGV